MPIHPHRYILPVVFLLTAPAFAQQKDDSLGRAATSPLRDTRIRDDKIPEILQLAASAPYSSANSRSCGSIRAEIAQLNEALGTDVDTPAQKKGQAAQIGATATRGAIAMLIPGLSLVRVITGADKAQARVEAAVHAGSVRRGYLKGVGLARGCRAPAAPLANAVAERPELLPLDTKSDE